MLTLRARYQLRAVGAATNDIHNPILGDDGSPGRPSARAMASQPSKSSRSLTARHHLLPGGSPSTGRRTPRSACQRMNDVAALLNGLCRPVPRGGP